ncbi:hypothetical protein FOA52_010743 [Chlamydomonas sp. UWO 241]|nr:hypothetical protein FOA52_010743 [Chlamydomonas sp. UWO 241]
MVVQAALVGMVLALSGVVGVIYPVCLVQNPGFTECSPNASTDTFDGFDINIVRFIGSEAGWEEIAYTPPLNLSAIPDDGVTRFYLKCMPATVRVGPVLQTLLAPDTINECALGAGAFTVTEARWAAGIRFSYPYYRTGVGVLISSKTPEPEYHIWGFLEPFHWSLWLALLATLIVLPVIVWAVENLSRTGTIPYDREALSDWSHSIYTTFLTVFNLEVVKLLAWPAQLIIVCFCFLILVSVSSYTANLAAALTVTFRTSGFTSVDDLRGLSTRAHGIYVPRIVENQLIRPEPADWHGKDTFLEQRTLLMSGESAAYFFDKPILQYWVRQIDGDECSLEFLGDYVLPFDYGLPVNVALPESVVSSINVGILSNVSASVSAGNVALPEGVESSSDVGLLNAQAEGVLARYAVRYQARPTICVAKSTTTGADSSLRFQQVSGLWVILACAVGVGVIGSVWGIYKAHYRRSTDAEEGEMLTLNFDDAASHPSATSTEYDNFSSSAHTAKNSFQGDGTYLGPPPPGYPPLPHQRSLGRSSKPLAAVQEGHVGQEQQQQQQEQQQEQQGQQQGQGQQQSAPLSGQLSIGDGGGAGARGPSGATALHTSGSGGRSGAAGPLSPGSGGRSGDGGGAGPRSPGTGGAAPGESEAPRSGASTSAPGVAPPPPPSPRGDGFGFGAASVGAAGAVSALLGGGWPTDPNGPAGVSSSARKGSQAVSKSLSTMATAAGVTRVGDAMRDLKRKVLVTPGEHQPPVGGYGYGAPPPSAHCYPAASHYHHAHHGHAAQWPLPGMAPPASAAQQQQQAQAQRQAYYSSVQAQQQQQAQQQGQQQALQQWQAQQGQQHWQALQQQAQQAQLQQAQQQRSFGRAAVSLAPAAAGGLRRNLSAGRLDAGAMSASVSLAEQEACGDDAGGAGEASGDALSLPCPPLGAMARLLPRPAGPNRPNGQPASPRRAFSISAGLGARQPQPQPRSGGRQLSLSAFGAGSEAAAARFEPGGAGSAPASGGLEAYLLSAAGSNGDAGGSPTAAYAAAGQGGRCQSGRVYQTQQGDSNARTSSGPPANLRLSPSMQGPAHEPSTAALPHSASAGHGPPLARGSMPLGRGSMSAAAFEGGRFVRAGQPQAAAPLAKPKPLHYRPAAAAKSDRERGA